MSPVLLVVVLAVALGVVRIRSFRRRGLGLPRALGISPNRAALENVLAGTAIAFTAIGATFLMAYAAGTIEVAGFGTTAPLTSDLLTFVMVPLQEELVFRSALLGGLLVLWPRHQVAGVLLSAALFGGLHMLSSTATLLSGLGSTLGGVAYGMAFAATQALWLSFGLHFAWNYAQGPVLGFALSGGKPLHGSFLQQESVGPAWFTGGDYGPEGGVVGLVGRAVVLLLLVAWLRYRKHRAGCSRAGHVGGTMRTSPGAYT
jgi:uncharacterized protein